MLAFSATSTTAEMERLLRNLTDAALQVPCTEAAQAIQGDYADLAPKDTTSMVLSCYVVPAQGAPSDNYSGRTNAAQSVNPRVVILPAVAAPPAPGTAVAVAAEHGAIVEYGAGKGTSSTPRPMFARAGEAERQRFPARVAAVVWRGQ